MTVISEPSHYLDYIDYLNCTSSQEPAFSDCLLSPLLASALDFPSGYQAQIWTDTTSTTESQLGCVDLWGLTPDTSLHPVASVSDAAGDYLRYNAVCGDDTHGSNTPHASPIMNAEPAGEESSVSAAWQYKPSTSAYTLRCRRKLELGDHSNSNSDRESDGSDFCSTAPVRRRRRRQRLTGKAKKARDDERPKRKPNGYFLYLQDYRSALQDKKSFGLSHALMLRVAGKMWYQIPEATKTAYGELAAAGGAPSAATSVDAAFREKQHGFHAVSVPLVLAGMRALVRSCVDTAFDEHLTETRLARERYTSVNVSLAREVAVHREEIYVRWRAWLGTEAPPPLPPLFDEAEAALTDQDLRPFMPGASLLRRARKAEEQRLREIKDDPLAEASDVAPPDPIPTLAQVMPLLSGYSEPVVW